MSGGWRLVNAEIEPPPGEAETNGIFTADFVNYGGWVLVRDNTSETDPAPDGLNAMKRDRR